MEGESYHGPLGAGRQRAASFKCLREGEFTRIPSDDPSRHPPSTIRSAPITGGHVKTIASSAHTDTHRPTVKNEVSAVCPRLSTTDGVPVSTTYATESQGNEEP